jgi:restriction system protein
MLPKQREVEIPLLQVLVEIGGQGRPKDIYPLVTKKFPEIRDEDLAERLPSGPNKWTNLIQWVRQGLIQKGDMDSPAYGVWRITDQGRTRLSGAGAPESAVPVPTFKELYDDYESAFRAQLLEKVRNLSPRDFEYFGRRLLKTYGFVDVTVTTYGQDGGIDGDGKVTLGLATMRAAFQCKNQKANVGRPQVDAFRGAIQGSYEQGVFFTTSDFTSAARDVSIKKGAVPIILLNGESIVDLMIEKGLGVQRVPLYAFYERPDDFSDLEDN